MNSQSHLFSHFPVYQNGYCETPVTSPLYDDHDLMRKASFESDLKRKVKRSEPSYTRTRSAANQRERRRMQCINEAFEGLRSHIPTLPYEKRLSKVDTLRLAICYINFLTELVGSDGEPSKIKGNALSPQISNQGKIVIYSASKDENTHGLPPIRGHSLSWSRDSNNIQRNRHVRTKEIWRPEIRKKEVC